jgi:hypothetical protein
MRYLIVIATLFATFMAHAELTHERVRRVTVFPIKVDKELDKAADETWWDLRERLTESKRFLVASKNFMQSKDVFQPRGELQPADAIILGRLLDANALISTFVVDRKLSMRVYETKNGLTLWSADIELHPAIPVAKQLNDACRELLYDFTSSIPYQGAVIVDNLIGRATYSEGEKLLFKADVGAGTQISTGDAVQLIRIKPDRLKPLFQDGSTVEVYAEGVVVAVDRQIITAQITRKLGDVEIKADALVRIPDELRRLKEIYGMQEDPEKNIGVEIYQDSDDKLTDSQKKTKPLVTSLSWIGNMALILLLAF